ncbi:MAG TPA: hypothetical protein ENJ62_04165 [Bryobacterales bacterium]|nr:hypothetical protein [Bryobacterales bacterium]
MASDRKYRHRGYMESDSDYGDSERRERRPRGPRPPIDVTGPRLPRMVQTVAAARCYNCAVTLPPGTDFKGNCPKCGVALHCCKQCAYFEPSMRFQCAKPIRQRIGSKDKPNECEFFETRVTVARDTTSVASSPVSNAPAPQNPKAAREAFDNLFKK